MKNQSGSDMHVYGVLLMCARILSVQEDLPCPVVFCWFLVGHCGQSLRDKNLGGKLWWPVLFHPSMRDCIWSFIAAYICMGFHDDKMVVIHQMLKGLYMYANAAFFSVGTSIFEPRVGVFRTCHSIQLLVALILIDLRRWCLVIWDSIWISSFSFDWVFFTNLRN